MALSGAVLQQRLQVSGAPMALAGAVVHPWLASVVRCDDHGRGAGGHESENALCGDHHSENALCDCHFDLHQQLKQRP